MRSPFRHFSVSRKTFGIGPSSETDQQQQTSTMATTIISSSSSSYSKPCSRPIGDDDADYTDTDGDEQLKTSHNQNTICRATSSAKFQQKYLLLIA
ncbi:unnamed protein product [Rotaria sp. Silwood2]|nr:unnamed protein product [Rotaria sp. Silwood2]CAF3061599.1 unnamed protein product [Rotaria sp. Silwood2]CAF3169951.1 unnamed protein product [Rotaria sp. Silwood2]CAF3315635.1 unnamed protein product [Rotaria sp. Silwood2]CAF4288817.1 unnamed protein product [Rotaria sp. Silwood2]